MNKQRGRPKKGADDGRARILAAAGELFVGGGYQRTTLRSIAEKAGCDVALISYHFGSKKGLFAQAMALELAPAEVLERAFPGDPDTLGIRLLVLVTTAWERPEVSGSLTHLVQMAMTDEEVRQPFLEYLDREVMTRIVEYFGGRDARARATAALTLVIGVIFGRYVLRVPSLAGQDAQQFLDSLAPSARVATTRRVHRVRTGEQT
ncbi:TetR/AcrR family transcriptional regulator [Microbacterium esteraromaticum]|uniref:TetR/AcrR family transcriptional regulator n=1 Tax=Microbacterium esteraromaticum TaxID=57043 RepID=A0A939DZA2_9MICO|nr:TetR/AcrR family transcriptional regulator [Microbacterium esteraromaticum]MBN8206758.1 TetR/AcrR family transcriptional regulator [Microbacterium esteraromaticum]MBN8416913.1 TetR/AcrR family transcriptional regulator [Microbacterium esteraromaticum]